MKFRKKPVLIEAEQYSQLEGLNTPFLQEAVCEQAHEGAWGEPHIHTLEGNMKVSHLDWIVKGVHDEFYPVKPDIFEKTYELVK